MQDVVTACMQSVQNAICIVHRVMKLKNPKVAVCRNFGSLGHFMKPRGNISRNTILTACSWPSIIIIIIHTEQTAQLMMFRGLKC